MENYFLTNCIEDRIPLMLEIAAELGIKMHTELAYDIDHNLIEGYLAIHLDEGYTDMTEFWVQVTLRNGLPKSA
jgi:hypothetical protein